MKYLRRSGIARIVKGYHSFTLLGGTIPAFAFQVDLGAAAEAAKAEP